jgi:tripartite-type tricarboxylate transporter receptor subunit TctC
MLFMRFGLRLTVLGIAVMLALPAAAQQFPSRTIRIILGFGPGGTTDAISRLYAQKMSEILNTSVIVDNKPGGNQMTAIRALQLAPADGHTLYAGTGSSLIQNPALRKDLDYDPLKDFTLIGIAAYNPGVIFIDPKLPIRSIGELVAYAKANPGKLNYGSAGVGSAAHLAAEAFMSITGAKMSHIPYKSDVDVIRETMAGNVQMGIFTTVNTVPFITSGKIRALAVTTPQRLPFLPDVPSVTETDVKRLTDLEPHTFISFVGPAGMPPAIAARLNEVVNKISAMPDVASRVRETFYSEPATITPSEFRQFIEKEIAKWKVVGQTVKLTE